jgi:hypothetical protein
MKADTSVQEVKKDTESQLKEKREVKKVSRGSLNVVMSGLSVGKSGDAYSKSHVVKGFMHEIVHTHTKAGLREAFDAVDPAGTSFSKNTFLYVRV